MGSEVLQSLKLIKIFYQGLDSQTYEEPQQTFKI